MTKKWICLCVILSFAVGLMVGLFVPFNITSYQTLTVQRDEEYPTGGGATGYAKDFRFGETWYLVGYSTDGKVYVGGFFGDSDFLEENLEAVEGKTYKVFGAEITVSQVHDDYIIVTVKSL